MTRLTLALVLTLPLLGCGPTAPPAIQTQVLPDVAAPKPAPMRLRTFRWQVLNAADLARIVDQKAGDPEFVIIALTPDGYKALSGNMLEVQRYIREQQNVIVYLRETIEDRSK